MQRISIGIVEEITDHQVLISTVCHKAPAHQRAPLRQHEDPVAQPRDQVHVVLDDAERDALGHERAHQRRELGHQRRRHAGGGLVQENKARREHERAGELQQLLLPAGERRRRRIRQLPQPDAHE